MQSGSGSSVSPSGSGGPGSQRDFYQHVSGAGDGHTLQTSSSSSDPKLPLAMEPALPSTTTDLINPKWRSKIQELNENIVSVLKSAQQDAEVTVGRKSIRKHKVFIDFRKEETAEGATDDGYGVILYLAVRTKYQRGGEDSGSPEDHGEDDSRILAREKSFYRDEEDEIGPEIRRGTVPPKSRKSGKKESPDRSPERRKQASPPKGDYSEVEDTSEEEEGGFRTSPRSQSKKSVRWSKVEQRYVDEDDEGKEYDVGREDDDFSDHDGAGRRVEDSPRYAADALDRTGARSREIRDEDQDNGYEESVRYLPGVDDDRRIVYEVRDSPRSQQKERILRQRRKELKRRRRRQSRRQGEPFSTAVSDEDGGLRRTRSLDSKDRARRFRSSDATSEEEDYELGEYGRDGDHRHEPCFYPFHGYGEYYDGPVGYLTSKLPDGSSTAGEFTFLSLKTQKIKDRKSGKIKQKKREKIRKIRKGERGKEKRGKGKGERGKGKGEKRKDTNEMKKGKKWTKK